MHRLLAVGTLWLALACGGDATGPSIGVVALDLDSITLAPGGAIPLHVSIVTSQGDTVRIPMTWKVVDTVVATIDTTGLLTSRAPGTTRVVVRAAARSDTVMLTVASVTFTRLSAGPYHACGLTPAGEAYCWGSGYDGELGIGANQTSTTGPARVRGGKIFVDVGAGYSHTCARTATGEIWCWGANRFGQMGLGSTDTLSHAVPQSVAMPVAVASLRTGPFHTCALAAGGAAYCWGYNSAGQTGQATFGTFVVSPTPVGGGLTFLSVATGLQNTCGIAADSLAYCWGGGILGVDSTPPPCGGFAGGGFGCPEPVPVSGGRSYASIDITWEHACAGQASGSVYCWGPNGSYQLGQVTPADHSTIPILVSGGFSLFGIAAGGAHSCGLTSGGAAYCWGANDAGQLGDGTGGSQSQRTETPTSVAGGLIFVTVVAGFGYSCGLTAQGIAYCWGANDAGRMGVGGTFFGIGIHTSPVRITGQP